MSPILQFLWVTLLVFLGVAKATFQSAVCKKYVSGSQDSVLFTAILFMVVTILSALIYRPSVMNREILIYAVLVGIGNFTFQVAYTAAMNKGPVSLTVVIINFGIVVPTVFSAIWYHEEIYFSHLIAIVFLLFSLLLSTKKTENQKEITTVWLILALVGSLFTGVVACIQKEFSLKVSSKIENASATYLVVSYLVSSLLAFLYYFIKRCLPGHEKTTFGPNIKRILPLTAAAGLFLCLYQKSNVAAGAVIDGSFLFPLYCGMATIIMSIVGVVFFHDVLVRRQKIGIALGTISVILLNLRFGFHFVI